MQDSRLSKLNVLKVDSGGIPYEWIDAQEAVQCIYAETVLWSMGSIVNTMHGGYNKHGARSIIEVPSIIAVKGESEIYLPDVPIVCSKEKIFKRDRNMCAYCGTVFKKRELQAEHIHPKARGGPFTWMNMVTACNDCNQLKKKCRTPEEAGMPLVYLPYVPSYWEDFIMRSRNIMADQMEFLMANVPKHSRLRN